MVSRNTIIWRRGNRNKYVIYKGLRERGFSKQETAVIMGNLRQESSYDTTAGLYGKLKGRSITEDSYGLMQWRNSSSKKEGRLDKLAKLARKKGKHISDIGVQLDYIKQELTGKGPEAENFKEAMSYTGLSRKTMAFADLVERPADSELSIWSTSYSNRTKAAHEWYDLDEDKLGEITSSHAKRWGEAKPPRLSPKVNLKRWDKGEVVKEVFTPESEISDVANELLDTDLSEFVKKLFTPESDISDVANELLDMDLSEFEMTDEEASKGLDNIKPDASEVTKELNEHVSSELVSNKKPITSFEDMLKGIATHGLQEETDNSEFSQRAKSLSMIEPDDTFTENNVDAVLDDKLENFIPQMREDTPIIASAGSVDGILPQEIQETQSGSDSEVPQSTVGIPKEAPKADITIPNFSTPEPEMAGRRIEFDSTMLEDLEKGIDEFTLEGMGNDLVNNFVDRNAVGFVTEGFIKHKELSKEIDYDYDATKDPIFNEMTAGMDADDLEEVLKYSRNRHDFITSASLINGRMKRTKEMEEYSREHPVLSGANTVGNILTEGAVFMPVSTLASAAVGATRIKKVSDLYKASRAAKFAIGELIEQGGQEIIWAQNAKDYEFDPIMFAAGVGAGVGLKSVFGSTEADAAFREILKNEGGFINLTTENGKKLVDEVTRNLGTEQAIALAENITKRKQFAANSIRENLKAKRAGDVKALGKVKKQLKSAKKGTDVYKKLKGRKQQLSRSIEKFDKDLPSQMQMLVNGTHPKLTAAVDPTLDVLRVAEELGIDKKLVNTPKKIRKFLGLDSADVDPDFVVEGEEGYKKAMRVNVQEMRDNKRLNANESLRYLAGTSGVQGFDNLPLLGKLQIADKLKYMAETDGPVNKLLFNKGNLVSSDNPYTASYYNWMSPDGAGREGGSHIRAIESQQKYTNIYGGELMSTFHTEGDKLYTAVEGSGILKKLKQTFNADSYEEVVEPLFSERLTIGEVAFREKYGDEIANIADDFAKRFNKNNDTIITRAKETGVEGIDFETTDDWFTRQWDNRAARATNEADLDDTIFRAMKSHAEKLGIKNIDEADMRIHAKKFAIGLRKADLGAIEGANSGNIKYMEKLLSRSEGIEGGIIDTDLKRLKKLKSKADAGDLSNRVQMDVNVKLADGRPLSDLFEKNVIASQKRYISRMSARIAAAEHGVKNINDLDDWITDAVEYEVQAQAKKGVRKPLEEVKHMEASMRSDLNSFKNGGMSGLYDITDDTASDTIKMVKKYNVAKLLQYAPISSIGEVGTALVEAGVSTVLREYLKPLRGMFNDMWSDNPTKFVDSLYDELRTITGVGMEDFAFSSKGMSKAARLTDEGSIGNTIEKGIDVMGRMTHGTFGFVETTNRRVITNALAIRWAKKFTGRQEGGALSAFFGSNGFTNRVLENSGFGRVTDAGEFIPNAMYGSIKKHMNDFATFDERGNLLQLNLHKWDSNVKQAFGDALNMQGGHIMVTPDATTMALWQSTPIGLILNQFGSYTINATTKVLGHAVGNAVISSNRGDHSEMIKLAQKMFWGTVLGTLAVTLRQGIQRAGGDKEIDLFDEGLIKAAAIGWSRSSMSGNLPAIMDSVGGQFGYDPMFEKTSSTGRSKDFFNLMTTPTGQAVSGIGDAGSAALKGDFGEAGMKLLKTSPLYRQIGAQQIFNYIDDEK